MSKTPPDAVELLRLSSNGSMSISGSFTHTDIQVDAMTPPLYQTVPDAQTAHKEYHRMSKKSKSSSPTYQPPGEGEAPNEYDIIPDNQRKVNLLTRDTSPVVVADNVLYGDQNAAEQMRHKALTMEKSEEFRKKYSGNTSQSLLRSESKDSYGGTCCSCQIVCTYVVIIAVFLVAVAALVLSLIILLRVYSVCDCGATPQEFANLQESFSRLQSEMQALKQELNDLRSDAEVNITAVSSSLTMLSDNLGVIQNNITTTANDVVNQRITNNGVIIGLNFSVELSGVRLYDECVTSVEAFCEIQTGRTTDGTSSCTTVSVPIQKDGMYTLDASCVRTVDSIEQNPLTTLLDVIPNTGRMLCICNVVIPNAANAPFEHSVRCDLQVTRCPDTISIPANLVTTQTNF